MDRDQLIALLARALIWLRNLFRKSATKGRKLRDSVQFPINVQLSKSQKFKFGSSFMDRLPKAALKVLREVIVLIRRLIA
jgi:hypothetical protein